MSLAWRVPSLDAPEWTDWTIQGEAILIQGHYDQRSMVITLVSRNLDDHIEVTEGVRLTSSETTTLIAAGSPDKGTS